MGTKVNLTDRSILISFERRDKIIENWKGRKKNEKKIIGLIVENILFRISENGNIYVIQL